MSMDRPVAPVDDDLRSRRDLVVTAGAMALVGLAAASWPLIDSMNPSAELRVPFWIDLSRISVGQRKTVVWRNKPIFIVHRTPEEIAAARAGDHADMLFLEPDRSRVQRSEWVVVYGICPSDGCPLYGQEPNEMRGHWGGWYCPCPHGPHSYDLSGRLRSRRGNSNLLIPPYRFESDTAISLGTSRLKTNP
jgi:ubiquinol-cytochrome c reductase iron-sulfur subunit